MARLSLLCSTFYKHHEIYREVSSTPLLLTRSTNDPVQGMENVRVRDSCIMLAVASTVFMPGQDLDSIQLGAVWTLELPHYQLSTHLPDIGSSAVGTAGNK